MERTGHLTLVRDGVVEHLRNTEDGLQQEWVFSSAPRGSGELVMTLPAKGLTYVGATDKGLHFKDEQTGLGVRYGHAAWVEASGRSTPVLARYVAGALQLRVPEEVVSSSVFPATVAPVISPEFGMDQPVPGRQTSLHEKPAVASNGADSLVVWEDFREGIMQVYGTRVSSSGAVLDSLGLDISRGARSVSDVSVASNGADYLVAWTERTESTTRAMAARVTGGGGLPDTAPFILTQQNSYSPAVTSNGTAYFVTWIGTGGVFGSRVTSAGEVEDPMGIAISTSAGAKSQPAAASNGTDYFVVWEDERNDGVGDIFGARVSGLGVVLDAQGIALATGTHSQRTPSVASNGSDYLVAWKDTVNIDESDIFGTRVTSTGAVLDGPGFEISTAEKMQANPSVASNGEDYFVVWTDNRSGYNGLRGTRVTNGGTVVDVAGQELSPSGDSPAVAFNGTDYFIAWESGWDAFGMRVTQAGGILDSTGIILALAASTQTAPVVASNGTDFLVVWYDRRNLGESIVGVRVDPLGEVLDPSGLEIALGTADGMAYFRPTVASNGTDYLVGWVGYGHSQGRIFGTRITRTGEVVKPGGLPLSPASLGSATSPKLASNGTDYLLVFEASEEQWTPRFLAGVRVSGAGVALDASAFLITPSLGEYGTHAVASNGKDYLVAWSANGSSDWDIHASRVTSTGAVLDPAGLIISAERYNQRFPSVASNGTDYLVAWAGFSGRNIPHIYGARVTSGGARLDPAGFVIATEHYQRHPSVASMGTEYLVAWQDNVVNSPDSNVYGARVTSAGIVREPQGFVIAGSTDNEETPAVVFLGTGRTALVAYPHDDRTAPYWGYRIRGRLVTFNDNRPPAAVGQSVSTPVETPLPLTLQGTDPDGQSVTYQLLTQPQHGTLTGFGANPTYQPAARYSGPDSFSFRVSDGEFFSAAATVSIQVTNIHHPPSAPVLIAPEADAHLTGGLVTFRWDASTDAEGDALAYDLEILQGGTRLRLYRTAETARTLAANEALAVGSYSWRVSAVDAQGASSAPSPERGFSVVDEAPQDGGSGTDGGEPDGGSTAGTEDAGVPDAGAPVDETPEPASGCGCNPVAGSTPTAPLFLAALGVWVRWSRRRR
ncbi:Ig-like domain-containing protein [Corallococcus sp. EGB]|uniref:Ig-like domain-containing protein n=1 Tax=Corallococcus sp. EGB TaxID=1521117 RepID=UPI001CC0F857|nr:Ig-like domain-containing protein [Corallococcus sp. EGB]